MKYELFKYRLGRRPPMLHTWPSSECAVCRYEKDARYVGVIFCLTSVWIGVYYSSRDKRICINLIPFLTIWFTRKGGKTP